MNSHVSPQDIVIVLQQGTFATGQRQRPMTTTARVGSFADTERTA